MEFPCWLTHPLLVNLSAVSEQCQQELCELQQDRKSVKTLVDQRNHDVAFQGMRKEIPSLEYLGKTKIGKFSVIVFGRTWV